MSQYLDKNITYTDFTFICFTGSKDSRQLLFIPYLIMLLISIIANLLLIFIIASQRSLHSPMYILIGMMAFVDLTSPITYVPNMLFSLLLNWNYISLMGCLVQMFSFHFIGTFQSTVLMWMALDRYYAICKPLHYSDHMSLSSFKKFVILPVLRNAAFILAFVSLAGNLSYCQNEIDQCFCEHMALVTLACGSIRINNIAGFMTTVAVPATDFLLIVASYARIFFSVFKSGKSSQKALSTCVTHIIVITVTLTFALISVVSYRIKNNMSSNTRTAISTIYLLVPSCFNPIIYGIRTKEIRQQLQKLMKCGNVTPQH